MNIYWRVSVVSLLTQTLVKAASFHYASRKDRRETSKEALGDAERLDAQK
jgi:hypothetical protein